LARVTRSEQRKERVGRGAAARRRLAPLPPPLLKGDQQREEGRENETLPQTKETVSGQQPQLECAEQDRGGA